MKLFELIRETEILSATSIPNEDIHGLRRIPDKIDTHTLLFDFYNPKYDRCARISKLTESRPAAIVTERPADFDGCDIPIITVKNCRRTYAEAYSRFCEIDYSKLIFVGITGTNGKTTTATMLKEIFESVGIKVGFIGTGLILSNGSAITDEKYSMTSPDPEILYPAIKRIENDGCEIIVMEVSSHALSLEKTAPIPFYISIFTGLSHEHIDFHGDMESYYRDKEKLIKSASYAIVNCDDPYGQRLYRDYHAKTLGVALNAKYDCRGVIIKERGLLGTDYVYQSDNFSSLVKLKLGGKFNVYNSMLAFTCASMLGIIPRHIKSALGAIKGIDGRLEIIISDITVIIDFAHTPLALESLLETVRQGIKPKSKMTLIFGCGGERDRNKRPQMAKIAESYCDKVIITNDNPRGEDEDSIIKDICDGFTKNCYGVIKSRAEAIRYAIKNAKKGDTVILAGKGHERYIYDLDGFHSFDERIIIKEAMKHREDGHIIENKT